MCCTTGCSYIIGIYNLIISCTLLGLSVRMVLTPPDDLLNDPYIEDNFSYGLAGIVLALLLHIAGIFLVIGALKDKNSFLAIWLVLFGIYFGSEMIDCTIFLWNRTLNILVAALRTQLLLIDAGCVLAVTCRFCTKYIRCSCVSNKQTGEEPAGFDVDPLTVMELQDLTKAHVQKAAKSTAISVS